MQCTFFIEVFGDGIFKNRTIIVNADPNTFCDVMQKCPSRSATAQLKNTGVYVCMYVSPYNTNADLTCGGHGFQNSM